MNESLRLLLRYLTFVALAAVVYLCFLIIRPFLTVIAVSGSIAILLHPLHARLAVRIGNRRGTASLLLIALVFGVVLLPLFAYGLLIGEQALRVIEWSRPYLNTEELRHLLVDILPRELPLIDKVRATFGLTDARLASLAAPVAGKLLRILQVLVQGAVAGVATAFLQTILFVVLLFFCLRDGHLIAATARLLMPLSRTQEDAILLQIARTVKGVLLAMVVVPLAQGALAVLGFLFFGLPDAFFWGGMLVFAALIPGFGSTLAWIPCALWLYFARSPGAGIGMALYGVFVISAIDNIIKPLLLREAASIHPMLAFLATFGGILAFGLMGFLLGPVVLSMLLAVIAIYKEQFSETEVVTPASG